MKGINQVHFIGSIAKNPELKYTPGDLAILELTVAGKEQVVNADGETRTAVFYNRCKAFGPYAEALAESFQAGDVVTILGRLDYRSYEKDGEKRSTVETVISSVQTLEGRLRHRRRQTGPAGPGGRLKQCDHRRQSNQRRRTPVHPERYRSDPPVGGRQRAFRQGSGAGRVL